jgi:hypothetical protein
VSPCVDHGLTGRQEGEGNIQRAALMRTVLDDMSRDQVSWLHSKCADFRFHRDQLRSASIL